MPFFVARGSRKARAPCTELGTARAPGGKREKTKTLVGSAAAGPLGQRLRYGLEPWGGYLQLAGDVPICNTDLPCSAAIDSSQTTEMVLEGPSNPLSSAQLLPSPLLPEYLRGGIAHNRDLGGRAVPWFQSCSATCCSRGGESARCSSRARPHRARCHYKQFNLELQLTVTSAEELLFFPHRKAAGTWARFQRLS